MTEARAVEPARLRQRWQDARVRLGQPLDIASLAVFRALFGLLLAGSALRFMHAGWIERFYGERSFFFKYWGFGWVEPLSVRGMYLVYGGLALLSACVALGLMYRVAIVLLCLCFTYTELIDVTNYLNHYYLVSLLAALMSCMPLSGAYSLDAKIWPSRRRDTVPTWMLWLLRFQVCVVYFFAAKAKWGSDWLLQGQPLRTWLLPQVDLPLLGPWLVEPRVALIVSWLGMLHDLFIPPLLLWRRTRGWAFAALVVFHGVTSTWFEIGIFPLLMPMVATVIFDPGWARKAWTWASTWTWTWTWTRTGTRTFTFTSTSTLPCACASTSTSTSTFTSTPLVLVLALYCAIQLLIPLRSHLYGGNVLWHEQGMRYSWRVMVRTKHGSVHYRARLRDGRELRVSPRRYLTQHQEREMSGQPDLILQLAHHIARELDAQGLGPVQVRADALVALNGRPAQRMIDPDVDLAQVQDGLRKASWITLAPP